MLNEMNQDYKVRSLGLKTQEKITDSHFWIF